MHNDPTTDIAWPPRCAADLLALQAEYGSDANVAEAVRRSSSAVKRFRQMFAVGPYRPYKTNPLPNLAPVRLGRRISEDKIAALYAGRTYDDAPVVERYQPQVRRVA